MSELDVLFKEINKKFGDEVATLGVKPKNYSLLKFSSPRMNYCLYGGLPRYRLIQFAGPFGSGKTTSVCDIIANYQKEKDAKEVVYIDNEQTFDEQWANTLGVNTKKIRLVQPEGANDIQVFQMVLDIVKTGEAGIVVIDSLATLVPEQVADEDMDKQQRGGIAKSLAMFLNKIIPLLKKNECTLICLNQVRDSMDPYKMFTIPGGKALEHHSSVILIFQRGQFFDMKGKPLTTSSPNPFGNYVNASVYKTKVCRPDRKLGFYTLTYTKGIDAVSDTVDCGIEFGMINQRGAWFDLVDIDTGEILRDENNNPLKFQGREKVLEYFRNNQEAYDNLYSKVMEKLNDSN